MLAQETVKIDIVHDGRQVYFLWCRQIGGVDKRKNQKEGKYTLASNLFLDQVYLPLESKKGSLWKM